ncbi:precorrin-2 C(20)-methyltransferase [Desulfovibrio intestinalis]|uniref:Precorrin-2/cobalt-factor-2 C20-methyltransferase n=1 Tax=Desulfovibrio intestinalis TaxID=58621 RepID=A0A7W8C0V7_9BACT|nr:precorrin-2 C(20)-methyltransferase [Desulfovibrio intestinalis]MBB5142314.1 precorrin-2/cobalt-factor-2 C20-methyltransferase [Desulfovibrio intestinalis]
MTGVLYGVGVGPGAPDLLTLRAVNVLGKVDVILAAASPRNDYSAALETARPHLRPDVRMLRLEFPMTRDRAVLHEAWRVAAEETQKVLENGENAAFLTIGDPLVYSTFGYLMQTLKQRAPHLPVEIISGITSIQAAAARTGTILCENSESLRIIPGINSREELEKALDGADTAVILKAYRNLPAIVDALRATDRLDSCMLASHVEQPAERLRQGIDLEEGTPPYMSLVISRKPKK